jgi:hypothetical protein
MSYKLIDIMGLLSLLTGRQESSIRLLHVSISRICPLGKTLRTKQAMSPKAHQHEACGQAFEVPLPWSVGTKHLGELPVLVCAQRNLHRDGGGTS